MKDMLVLSIKIFLLFLFLSLVSLLCGYYDLFYIFCIVGLLMSGVTFFSIKIMKNEIIKKQNQIKTIFLDLDGTLLPFDLDQFVKSYFSLIAKFVSEAGYDSKVILTAINEGTNKMINNDGTNTNEEVFWQTFYNSTKIKREDIEPLFESFYLNDFNKIQTITKPNPIIKELINTLKTKGYQLVLATNPVFPLIATKQRIAWAGLNYEDFSIVTSYENCCFTKPSVNYYKNLFKQADVNSNKVLMIGNDLEEDGIIESLGASCFILTDYIINNKSLEVNTKYSGDLSKLIDFVNNLPSLIK